MLGDQGIFQLTQVGLFRQVEVRQVSTSGGVLAKGTTAGGCHCTRASGAAFTRIGGGRWGGGGVPAAAPRLLFPVPHKWESSPR